MKHDPAGPIPGALEGVGILVVEDDADARELYSLMLTLNGARVVTVAAAAAARAMLLIERFDLLVSDGFQKRLANPFTNVELVVALRNLMDAEHA